MKFYKINYFVIKKFNIINKKFLFIIILKNLFKNYYLKIFFINLFNIFFINKFYKKKKKITNVLIFNNILNKFIFICSLILFLEKKINYYKINFYLIFILKHCILHSQKFKHNNIKKFFIINYLI